MNTNIKIDIISDVACPWCYVRKKNLEKAIAKLPEATITVNWHPYQLDPNIPAEGVDRMSYLVNKFGSKERYEQLVTHLKTAGKAAGIDFVDGNRIPNTMSLHRLLHVASQEGFGNALKEAFFKAYFEEVVDLTKEEALVEIMATFGWDKARTVSVLHDEEVAYQVKLAINNAYNRNVSGVPYFIINDKYSLTGAQPPEVLMQAIQDIGAELDREAEAAACAIDDPNC